MSAVRSFFRDKKGVPVEGLEPPLTCVKQILSLSRLPFRHTGGVGEIMRGRLARDKEKSIAAGSGARVACLNY
jgi:hypothetical protein